MSKQRTQHNKSRDATHKPSASPSASRQERYLLAGWFAAFALPALFILLGGDGAELQWRYDRTAILQGDWWRMITGHWAHLGPSHFFLNLAGLIPIGLLFARELKPWVWVWVVACGVLTQSVGFLWFHPNLLWYVGLSGLLHTFLAAGSIAWIARGDRMGWGVLLAVSLKLLYEWFVGAMPWSTEIAGGRVVIESHAYGFIGGVFAILVYLLLKRLLTRSPS